MVITKGILNRVGFTLSELSICGDPEEYRIVFTSENSEAIVHELVKSPVNVSKRLQVFEIDEGTEIDLLPGYHSYTIYQTAKNNIVEVGILRVEETINTPTMSSPKNTVVYV